MSVLNVIYDASAGELWSSCLAFLSASDLRRISTADSWHRSVICADVALVRRLQRDVGLILDAAIDAGSRGAPLASSDGGDWALLAAWSRAMFASEGAPWEVSDELERTAVRGLVGMVNSSIRPSRVRLFRLSINGFEHEDLTDLVEGNRNHIFTSGEEEFALAKGIVGEVFLSLERPDDPEEGGELVELACRIGAVDACVQRGVLRPLTFHIYVCFPPLERTFVGSATVEAVAALEGYVKVCLGELAGDASLSTAVDSFRLCHTVRVLLMVEL